MPQVVGYSLGLTALRYPGAGGSELAFPANAVDFDGTNDRLERGASLTGQADSQDFILSLWFKINSDSINTIFIGSPPNNRFFLQLEGSSKLQLFAQSSAPATIWEAITDASYDTSTNTGWNHLLASRDGSGSGRHFYVNDVSATLSTDTNNSGTINFDNATNWTIGAAAGGGNEVTTCLSQVYLNQTEFLDFSDASNRRLFITAGGKPVDLGSDGSTPTGTAPIIFFDGATDTWHTNDGDGGGFTETGALTDCSDGPAD